MKQLTTILIPILTSLVTINAQNCRYKTNEIDKFTNKYTKLTKSEKVIGTFFTSGEFSIKKIDTSYYFIFDYLLSSYSDFEPYSIQKSAQLIFLLESGETVTLNSADDILGRKKTVFGLPPVYECFLTNVNYPVSKEQINLFFRSKV